MIHPMITDRLILREYTDADKNAYFRLKSDPKTMYYLQNIQLNSPEEADADLYEALNDQKSDQRRRTSHRDLSCKRKRHSLQRQTAPHFSVPRGERTIGGYP